MHKIEVIQIPVENSERTAKFYNEMFEWEFAPFEGLPTIQQTLSTNLPVMLSPVHDMHKPGGTFFAVSTDDIEHDLAKVEALDGEILMGKTQTPFGSQIALIRDPEGAIIVLTENT